MKIIPYFLILLISYIAVPAEAQRAFSQKSIDAHIDLVPLGFPDPAVRFGSELMLGNRWAVGMNLGVGVPLPMNTALGLSQQRWKKGTYQLFDIRPEVKFYWLKRERIGWYMAAEGLISSMRGSTGKSYHFLNDNDSLQVNFDYADFRKTRIGVTGKLGGRMLVGRRMTLDFFGGLGLSNMNAVFSNYQNRTTTKSDPFFEGQNYIAGKRTVAHISAGLRVGILLWRQETD